MKRTHSESETDDIFSGDEKDGDESCGGISRKKRRGIIEKRRRDRINNSLSELRRLVPAAFEKQGSAKLEKAEILQMTVDHLKVLHTKGLDALAYDPNKYAMDYHNIGFRECAAEVARYMVTVEGLDIQDPLRLRLMSHLQCFAAQREIASKQSAATWGWSSTPATPSSSGVSPAYHSGHNPGFQGHMTSSVPHPGMHHSIQQGSSHQSPSLGLDQSHGISAFSAPTSTHNDISTSTCNVIGSHPSMQQGPRILSSIPGTHHIPTSMPSVSMSPSGHTQTNYQINLNAHAFSINHHNLSSTSPNHLQSSHLSSSNLSPNLSLSSNQAGVNHSYGGGLQGSSGVKPYRPWGAEIAY